MRNKLYCIVLYCLCSYSAGWAQLENFSPICFHRWTSTHNICDEQIRGSVVAKLCNKSIIEITISLRPELKWENVTKGAFRHLTELSGRTIAGPVS